MRPQQEEEIIMTCNECKAKKTCPFYDKDADECVYEVLAAAAASSSGDQSSE